MCLFYPKEIKIRVDRACWKVYDNILGQPRTFFQEAPIPDSGIVESRIDIVRDLRIEEAIHSFARLRDAIHFVRTHHSIRDMFVYRCTIPKGTQTYRGIFRSGTKSKEYPSYASARAIIGKRVYTKLADVKREF